MALCPHSETEYLKDLIQVQIPRFTVTASDHHFETISNIITRLLLYSDAAHKTRLDHLETVLFQYDFNDLSSSAGVILDLQSQMRKALDIEYLAKKNNRPGDEESELELIRLRAHMFLLSERLNFLFEAIKLAQSRRDRRDEQSDRKSATLLHASSSEISWRMVDENRELLAKLAVQNIDFYWLRRQDSSTVNHLTVGDLQAFDGSRDATWAEILSKHDEPAYHPLLKVFGSLHDFEIVLISITARVVCPVELVGAASCGRNHYLRKLRDCTTSFAAPD